MSVSQKRTCIDVCVPVHRADAAYLMEMLESLRQQSFSEFSVRISDDGCGSPIDDIVDKFSNSLDLHVTRFVESTGMVDNWNRAVRLGSAEWAILLGQDDRLAPRALELLHGTASSGSGIVLCGSGRSFIDENGDQLRVRSRINDRSRIFVHETTYRLAYREMARLCLRNGNAFGEPSIVLFRRSAFDAIDGYDVSLRQVVDVDFNLRLSQLGEGLYVRESLLYRRRHREAETGRNVRDGTSSLERLELIERHAETAGLTAEDVQRCWAAAAVHCTFDLIRSVVRRWPTSRRVNAKLLWSLRGTRKRYVGSELMEILKNRNRDER